MEDSDRIRDNEVTDTQGESDISEQDIGAFPKQHKHRGIHVEGTEEIEERQRREKREKRVGKMEHAIRRFRIMSAGDGLLRGGFGKLPDHNVTISDLELSVDQFHLTGDNLNVSGNFDDGYAITRGNPCDQQQVNQNPT